MILLYNKQITPIRKSLEKNKGCEIWAIGGGKGGTGKSFITSSIGAHLAAKGKRVVLIDADWGGANLHSFFGVNRPQNSLSDFFEKKVPLKSLIMNCGISGLGLIMGNLPSLDSGDIKYAQKIKFFNHVKMLDADYILIDLGAGSHNNTMDTFLLADKMIVVIIPEITSIENMYHFIKNVFFRKLKVVLNSHGLKDSVNDAWKNRGIHGIKTLKELIAYLAGISPHIKDIIDKEMSDFRMHIILNQIRSSRDITVGTSIKSVCLKFLGMHTQYAGYIEYDNCVTSCINKKQQYMLTYPFSHVAKSIGRLSDNLIYVKEVTAATDEYSPGRL
ncbi:MAG: MinD/ParA family protein [Nitrospirae bacterium]|nr:MAG: MinD/ParA family protein [Nitrospirota bacterium]